MTARILYFFVGKEDIKSVFDEELYSSAHIGSGYWELLKGGHTLSEKLFYQAYLLCGESVSFGVCLMFWGKQLTSLMK